MKSKEEMEETEKCVDSQFWHACAGNMVQMPPVNSKVFYFPQGHFEQCSENVDLGNSPEFPAEIPCTVSTIKFMADPETDEVFAKIRLVPVDVNTLDSDNDGTIEAYVENQDKPPLVTKRLSQSDANCGGGFVIPKHWGEMIFPKLKVNTSDPADQMIHVKDIHGRVWEFKHNSNDKPSGHTLSTGWSRFVNRKKLVAGDSIFLMSSENGDLCVGIRREKSSRELVKVEDVTGAVSLAANGKPFEVVYWPRAGTPEFCVRASTVRAAKRIPWSRGMRFKMAFELEKFMNTCWFTGTILSVEDVDPVLWPDSPWRRLQVQWDVYAPQMNQNVKRISPWQVEKMELPPPQHPDVVGKDTLSAFSNNPFLGPESKKSKKSDNDKKAPKFMLLGQPIHTEEQISSMSPSSHTILNTVGNTSDGSGSDLNHNDRPEGSSCEGFQTELGYLCEVFTQSEDEIWTVDLSSLGSYEELYKEMASEFGIKISDIPNRVVCRDNAGVVRQLGKEPFSDFVKTAKSLMILADSGIDNVGV